MAQNKTTETNSSVTKFINAVGDKQKKSDSFKIIEIIQQHTGLEPKMWGTAIVGFGSYHYKYDSGREGDAPLVGFSPRANAISLYMANEPTRKEELLKKLGKHKAGKGCVYIKKLEDIDTGILKKMASESIKYLKSKYP